MCNSSVCSDHKTLIKININKWRHSSTTAQKPNRNDGQQRKLMHNCKLAALATERASNNLYKSTTTATNWLTVRWTIQTTFQHVCWAAPVGVSFTKLGIIIIVIASFSDSCGLPTRSEGQFLTEDHGAWCGFGSQCSQLMDWKAVLIYWFCGWGRLSSLLSVVLYLLMEFWRNFFLRLNFN